MADDFETAVDIANRALQLCGAARIASFTENSRSASETAFAYNKLRKFELRRNVWTFSVRKTVLRALDETSMLVVAPAWSSTETYVIGSLVTYNNKVYYATTNANLNTIPTTNTGWTLYYGPLVAQPYDTGTAYFSGEIVYTPADSTYSVYMSLQNSNDDVPTTIPAWDATVTYKVGDTVIYSATTYESTLDLNLNHVPGVSGWQVIPGTQTSVMQGQKWLKLHATIKSMVIVYPLGSGPRNQSATRNIFKLPNGFLREAPQDPKAGSTGWLGAPSGLGYTDWTYEDGYIVTRDVGPIILRFAADVDDVPLMDPMFCEGLAAKIALEVCEVLTQSSEKISNIGALYTKTIGEARIVNGIEQGPSEPSEDNYITCRM